MKPSVSIARKLRWIGSVLFLMSFFTPQIESGQAGLVVSVKDCGFGAFVMTPVVLAISLGNLAGLGDFLYTFLLAAAWLNNFSVFLRLPPVAAWIPISIPWSLLIIAALGWLNLGSLWSYIPFYPWALGIGLIHVSAYLEPKEAFDRWILDF